MHASILLSLLACKGKGTDDSAAPAERQLPWDGVPLTEEWELPGLRCDAHVLRTAGNVPYLYAQDRADLARVYGFVQARDRFFEMDLARRLGRGKVSELLGADALESDMDSRLSGMTSVGEHLLTVLTPQQQVIFDAFAEGVNAWIDQVQAGALPVPSEFALAGPLLGFADPSQLLVDWERADVAGMAAVLVYQLGYETDDVGRAATAAVLEGRFDGQPLGELRQAGMIDDIWDQLAPVRPYGSADGWGTNGVRPPLAHGRSGLPGPGKPLPTSMLQAQAARLERFERRLGRGDHEAGWGSNVWAVGAAVSSGGTALLAGDGHLPLSVPSLFWQVGLDTSVLGGGTTHQVGLGLPGLPILAVGTNGRVAWSQTQLMGDITDWYREELRLDEAGTPEASLYQGQWQPLVAVEEEHVVANVAILGSVGRTERWTRYETFDGRRITDIEGVEVGEDHAPAEGQAVLRFPGRWLVPQDIDGDGTITAISFDYAAFSDANILSGVDGFGHASDVHELREATRHLVAYSQNIGAADSQGSVLYTGYQAVPCRGYLPRGQGGAFLEGADPRLLLDGTTYGGFEIPIDADGLPIEGESDPYRCLVPFDEYPAALDPTQGYIVNANNDPGGITLDNDLLDEPWYIGGPWTEGFRAVRIDERIQEAIADGTADADGMASIQADVKSALGHWFSWHLVESIEAGRAANPSAPGAEGRLAALYQLRPEAMDEVQRRLEAWQARGFVAESGVETFYHSPSAEQVEDSVATSIFNAWLGYWANGVLGDEGLPDVWQGGGTTGRVRALTMFLEGRGEGNPLGLSSWNPETGESAFFDVLSTPEVERSQEVALQALLDALHFLESDPGGQTRGVGFGSAEMSTWKWGLRHQVRFESVLADFIDAGSFSFLTDAFSINTDVLPLSGEAAALDWFPRPGDNLSVDAANSGWGQDFTHGSGPVFRMVIELGPEGFRSGRNILPGGQSGYNDSPYFADQAALWLANQTLPLYLDPAQVSAAAGSRERFAGATTCP